MHSIIVGDLWWYVVQLEIFTRDSWSRLVHRVYDFPSRRGIQLLTMASWPTASFLCVCHLITRPKDTKGAFEWGTCQWPDTCWMRLGFFPTMFGQIYVRKRAELDRNSMNIIEVQAFVNKIRIALVKRPTTDHHQ